MVRESDFGRLEGPAVTLREAKQGSGDIRRKAQA